VPFCALQGVCGGAWSRAAGRDFLPEHAVAVADSNAGNVARRCRFVCAAPWLGRTAGGGYKTARLK